MNIMGGKASIRRSGAREGEGERESCSICRENHCQLAQNKSNTSLVPDSNGFVRVPEPVPVPACMCVFYVLLPLLLLTMYADAE